MRSTINTQLRFLYKVQIFDYAVQYTKLDIYASYTSIPLNEGWQCM